MRCSFVFASHMMHNANVSPWLSAPDEQAPLTCEWN